MALILSIETALDVCSVALHENGQLLHTLEISEPRSHASRLAPLIQQLNQLTGIALSRLTAIAVSAGPGSYTGLRIGISTAKGLCYALDIPFIALDTLDIMAQTARQLCEPNDWLCPVIDARRMDIYYKILDAQNRPLMPATAATLHESLFQPYFQQQQTICFVGNAAEKCKAFIRHPSARFLSEIHPAAAAMGEPAYRAWKTGRWQHAATFEPYYAKEFFTTLPR